MSDVKFLLEAGGRDPLYVAAQWLAQHFTLAPGTPAWDATKQTWPSREDVKAKVDENSNISGESYEHAFLAVFLLKDNGDIKARAVVCAIATEPNLHTVCETETGRVIDCRHPNLVLTLEMLAAEGYRPVSMSGFFEFGETEWKKCEEQAAEPGEVAVDSDLAPGSKSRRN